MGFWSKVKKGLKLTGKGVIEATHIADEALQSDIGKSIVIDNKVKTGIHIFSKYTKKEK